MRVFLARTAIVWTLFLVAAGAASAQSGAGAQRALQKALNTGIKAAAGATGAYVVDLTTGQTLFATGASTPRMPASVEKLYTTATALLRFGSNGTLTTNVAGSGSIDAGGTWHGTLYLKGGGDPTFGSASFDRYAYGTGATMQRLVANLVRQTGLTAVQGRIAGDEAYFDSERGTSATGGQASTYIEGLLSGLAYDRGLANEQGTAFQTRPALFAAQQFASALRAAGVKVPKQTPVVTAVTPTGAQPLTSVHSPRMATLIRLTNAPSDNYLAEMLLKGVGAHFGAGGTTAAGAAVVRSQVLQAFGIRPRILDGSGLSRSDRTSARDMVTTLRAMAANPDFVNSLSVAGETGTLQLGLQGTAAQGRCRGKTGTLHDVANEVGYCTARDGHTLAFAFLMNAVDPTLGHSMEDQMTVALAKYSG
ncbi:MAG TPA: D-alanyl-D-alanine carboxypeptidase/D-alanyl-D-alanine-endopeptidase [Solirubrobacteraceae bacterium]|nr:D-alanyl-D-alanine carboxypeptidase/D-alanyl-D-alanine-endopeptidase [Solirubrobacteraceae bacterium]